MRMETDKLRRRRLNQHHVRAHAYCPTCGVAPFERCVRKSGEERISNHNARVALARENTGEIIHAQR